MLQEILILWLTAQSSKVNILNIFACCFELLLDNYIKIQTNTYHTPVQSLFFPSSLEYFGQLTWNSQNSLDGPLNLKTPVGSFFFFLGIFHILDAKAKNKMMCKAWNTADFLQQMTD